MDIGRIAPHPAPATSAGTGMSVQNPYMRDTPLLALPEPYRPSPCLSEPVEVIAPVPDRDVPDGVGGVAGHGKLLSQPSASSLMASVAGPS
eukprot:9113542-Alexandrium_andersonii.AAC.1